MPSGTTSLPMPSPGMTAILYGVMTRSASKNVAKWYYGIHRIPAAGREWHPATRGAVMRLIRTILTLVIVVVVGLFVYNYWSGNGWTLNPPAGSSGVNAENARREGAQM